MNEKLQKESFVSLSFHLNKINSACPKLALIDNRFIFSGPFFQSIHDMEDFDDNSHGVWDRVTASDSGNLNATVDNNRLFGPIIGIDLGTSNSCVSLWHTVKNRAKIVKNSSTKSKSSVSKYLPSAYEDNLLIRPTLDTYILIAFIDCSIILILHECNPTRAKHPFDCCVRWTWFWSMQSGAHARRDRFDGMITKEIEFCILLCDVSGNKSDLIPV